MNVAAFATVAMALATGTPDVVAPTPKVDRFDERAAWSFLVRQVRMGPRPAGSPTLQRLATILKNSLPRGAFQPIPGHEGLRNVVGFVRGKDPSRFVIVGAHYDTKNIAGFVGANDGAGGTAVVLQLARTIKPRQLRPSVLFLFFDGEEATDDSRPFLETGLRGSKHAARIYKKAESLILLDFVADKDLSIPRERFSNVALWTRLRAAAWRVGVGAVFPPTLQGAVIDDHYPFVQAGIPSIDLIDFDFPCWHRTCDNLSAVSMRSIDAVGEAVYELLRGL